MCRTRRARGGADSAPPSLFLVLISAVLIFAGCATIDERELREHRQRMLIGKTKLELAACAGLPIRESEHDNTVELIYYKEASLLEESFPGSKGSVAKIHHGCRASVQLRENRVMGVHYQSIPDSYHDEEHCDEIFESCMRLKSQP
jgi:hypothetical protein